MQKAGLLALSLLLASCAHFTPPPEVSTVQTAEQQFEARKTQLWASPGFELTGRLAVSSAALSASLYWQQGASGYSLRIAGPFGAGAVQLDADGPQVRVRARGQEFYTQDAEGLLLQTTGVRVPLALLRYWILGVPAPQVPANFSLSPAGQLATLSQGGWQIDYPSYLPGPLTTPARVEARQGELLVVATVTQITLQP